MSIKEIEKTELKTEDKTVKQLVRELIERLPDDVDWERLYYHLGVVESVWIGLQEMKDGKGISHEEFLKRPQAWNELGVIG